MLMVYVTLTIKKNDRMSYQIKIHQSFRVQNISEKLTHPQKTQAYFDNKHFLQTSTYPLNKP